VKKKSISMGAIPFVDALWRRAPGPASGREGA
jgi:hypothetical protein